MKNRLPIHFQNGQGFLPHRRGASSSHCFNTWRSVLLWVSPHQIMYPVDMTGSVRFVAVPFTVSCIVVLRSVLVCVICFLLYVRECMCVWVYVCVRACVRFLCIM